MRARDTHVQKFMTRYAEHTGDHEDENGEASIFKQSSLGRWYNWTAWFVLMERALPTQRQHRGGERPAESALRVLLQERGRRVVRRKAAVKSPDGAVEQVLFNFTKPKRGLASVLACGHSGL